MDGVCWFSHKGATAGRKPEIASVFMLNSRDYSLLKKQSSFAVTNVKKMAIAAVLCHSLHTKLELCVVFPLLVGIISFFHTSHH